MDYYSFSMGTVYSRIIGIGVSRRCLTTVVENLIVKNPDVWNSHIPCYWETPIPAGAEHDPDVVKLDDTEKYLTDDTDGEDDPYYDPVKKILYILR